MRKYTLILAMIFLLTATLGCAKENIKDVETTAGMDVATLAEVEWIEDYDFALQQANDQDKVVLINFTGSDWCGWCKKLVKEVFSQPEFAKYASDNLVLLKLDFPTTFKELPQDVQMKRVELQEKYQVKGYPTILLVDSQGDVIAQTGYQQGGAGEYVKHLEGLINNTKK
jgi:protein disulfide-isomerase